MAEVEKIRNDY